MRAMSTAAGSAMSSTILQVIPPLIVMQMLACLGYRAMADRRLAATALAIRLYALDHDGQLPPTLDALAPQYLPAVPIDPMSGQSLRYLNEPRNPRIYSVGADGVDD